MAQNKITWCTIYTDGGCSYKNDRLGAYAYIITFGNKKIVYSAPSSETTHVEMELTAVTEALEVAIKNYNPDNIRLITDSRYVVDGYNRWLISWAKLGWTKVSGERIKHLDLWKRLYQIKQSYPNVIVQWTKGHGGSSGNNAVDEMVRATMKRCYGV